MCAWGRHNRDPLPRVAGVVEIFRCSGGDVLCGRLVWFRLKPGDSNLDLSNSDAQLRNRPLCGLVFMTGFRPAEPNNWEDGRVYNTDDGNTYHATMRLQPDGTLRLHGYIVVTLIGASEIWTRHSGRCLLVRAADGNQLAEGWWASMP